MSITTPRKCSNCMNANLKDFGYSDYTKEGTTVYCNLKLQEPFDRWYYEAKENSFAETCSSFKEGGPASDCSVECVCKECEYLL